MEDKNNNELDNANLDNEVVEQPANQDNGNANAIEQGKGKDAATIAKEKIIASAVSKIALGEKKLEDFDTWIVKGAKSQLDSFAETETTQEEQIEQRVRANISAETELNSVTETLSDDDSTAFSAEVQKLTAYGMPKSEAIEYAQRNITPTGANLPPAGRPIVAKTFNKVSNSQYDAMGQEQKQAYKDKSLSEFGEIAFS